MSLCVRSRCSLAGGRRSPTHAQPSMPSTLTVRAWYSSTSSAGGRSHSSSTCRTMMTTLRNRPSPPPPSPPPPSAGRALAARARAAQGLVGAVGAAVTVRGGGEYYHLAAAQRLGVGVAVAATRVAAVTAVTSRWTERCMPLFSSVLRPCRSRRQSGSDTHPHGSSCCGSMRRRMDRTPCYTRQREAWPLPNSASVSLQNSGVSSLLTWRPRCELSWLRLTQQPGSRLPCALLPPQRAVGSAALLARERWGLGRQATE
mmetsp:Transcript_42513/g.96067  ORF Transcript_42513/g.96067 Transcript_42513/m.96067 type:complete len:258 (-) Transcript_42513:723-1496(-)